MSFQAYIDNIQAKTGLLPQDFYTRATESGFLATKPTATEFVAWLARDYELGRGHAMAIYAVFKDKGWVDGRKAKAKRP